MKPKKKNSRKPVAGGTYVAVCTYSIGIGEQLHKYADSSNYHDDVVIGFELIGFTYEENGKTLPYDVSTTYTASMDERAKLRKHVEGWMGKTMTEEEADSFDTNDLVGRPALLGIVLNENGYNNINSIQAIPDSIMQMMPAPPQATMPLIRFDMEPWNQAAFDALPEWAQKRIMKSTEYQKNLAPVQDVAVQTPMNFQLPPQMANMAQQPVMQPVQTAPQQVPQVFAQPVQMPQQPPAQPTPSAQPTQPTATEPYQGVIPF